MVLYDLDRSCSVLAPQ